MQLQVQQATPADIDAAKSIYGPERGDLCAAAFSIGWPPSDSNGKERAEWSCQQQKEILENDSTTRFVKVVNEDNGELVAFGRWHRYPKGFEQIGDMEAVGAKNRADLPDEFNKAFYLGLLDDLIADRREWMGDGHYWVLTNIKTREPLQKNGAGSLILQWGLAQAATEGVPAYLESVAEAKSLYQKHGFREVGRQKVDCTAYGLPGVEFEVARMRADPK